MFSLKITLALAFSLVVTSMASPSEYLHDRAAAAVTYSVYPGLNMLGDDIAAKDSNGVLSEGSCMKYCSSVSNCVGYTYAPFASSASTAHSVCILKGKVNPDNFQSAATGKHDVSLGLRGKCGTFKTDFACFEISSL